MTDSCEWETIDRTLRGLAEQRAKLDAEEAKWLRDAERIQIWRQFGCASLLEYMERRLGYGPRAAQERLRVAFALEQLPVLAAALNNCELPFSAIREITRVATPETVEAWVESSHDKSVNEIQQMVCGHEKGDMPDTPPKPELMTKVLRYEVKVATYARMREAKAALERQCGQRLDDDALITAFCNAVLDPPIVETETDGVRRGRSKYQIAVTLCSSCQAGWQEGDGVQAPLDRAAVERAKCDAQHVGSIDTNEPARAKQDIAPAVRRLIWRRDGGKCTVPGCRSTHNLDVHHIIAREAGGSHDPDNLTLLCEAHHTQLHEGLITITGKAPNTLAVSRRHEPNVRQKSTKLDDITQTVRARTELERRGYSRPDAAAAIAEARTRSGAHASVDLIVALALERKQKS